MIVAIDTETYEYDSSTDTYSPILDARKFIIGCVMTDTGITLYFYDRNKMFDWLIKLIETNHAKKIQTYIYAHHTEYDWYAIAHDHLDDNRMKHVLFNPFLGIWDNKGYFLDSRAFYRGTLDDVGNMLGYPKLEMPKSVKHPMELIAYVTRDTEIVLKAILALKNRLKVLGFNPRKLMTAGQVAITCFMSFNRRNYTDLNFTTINKELNRKEIIKSKYPKLIRCAYRGGDNQALKLGKHSNVTLIDIKGHYGREMCDMVFPDLASERLHKDLTLGMFHLLINKYIGIARVVINAPTTNHPVLPIRFAKYQVFPSATTMRGTWTFMELKQAIKEGYVIEKIEWCITWKPLIVNKKPFNPFTSFINTLYQLEKNSKTAIEKAPIKMLRNNLSGKFGQDRKNKDYLTINRHEVMDYIEKGYSTIGRFDNKYIIMKETDDYNPSYTNAIISTLITARGRLKLWREECKIPFENRLYKDTDSLMFIDRNGTHINKFKLGDNLGEWKIEEQNVDCKILGEKRYYIGNKVKISGVHSKFRTLDVIEDEKDIKIKRIVSINDARRSGNWNDVGSFNDFSIEMKQHNKLMLPLPDFIDECKVELEDL